jgi:hypothetical protein
VQVEYDGTDAAPVLIVRKSGEATALGLLVLDSDLRAVADELLAELGL